MNRGISWGMFNETTQLGFWLITALIMGICGVLAVHAYRRFLAGYAIYGETLILAGGISNLVDRILFGGVLDFILFTFGTWSFPVFNSADAAIVLGAAIMIIQTFE
jgi:signal peptidase II